MTGAARFLLVANPAAGGTDGDVVADVQARLEAAGGTVTRAEGDDAALDAALAGITEGQVVNSDVHADAGYRTNLARVAAKRAIQAALSRAG